jgi:predicted molibdopterin-dependent oxidoreductase YjgC
MAPRLLPFAEDPAHPAPPTPLAITVDGERVSGLLGQSIAGVVLAGGVLGLRRTSEAGRPRGVFCGIGVCYDCLVEVNGQRDVRACQRRAVDGDEVRTQHDLLPVPPGTEARRSDPGT